jgi:hypothetical protein
MDGEKLIPAHSILIYSRRRVYQYSIHLDPLPSTMNQENNNVVGRLGSTNDYEHGDKIMYSMPEEASSNESSTHQSEEEDSGFLFHYSTTVATLSAAFFGTIIVSLLVSRMWDEDQIKLHILDTLIKMLQGVARLTGGWALECERAYNDHVNTLH